MQLLAGLALPLAGAFVYVGVRFPESAELPSFIAALGAGRALVQVLVERSLGYELSLAPLAGMLFVAWYLRRAVVRFPDGTRPDLSV